MELPANYVYVNNWYVVIPEDSGIGYMIVNTRTQVKEGFSEVLHSAISKADAWCELIEETVESKNK